MGTKAQPAPRKELRKDKKCGQTKLPTPALNFQLWKSPGLPPPHQPCLGFPAPTIYSQGSRLVGGSPGSITCAEQLQHKVVFFFLFPSLTLCKVGRVEENPYWGLIKMPQALSEGFLVVRAPCSAALKASPAQTIPSSYPGSSGEILGQSMTSLTYLRAPAENTWATLPHIKRRQETGTGFLQLAGAIHDVGHRPTGHPANPQCTARAQDLAVPACQTPSHHQKAPVTHLLISHARILQRGRRFCNPELVLNSQVEGDEAQVTATMLQGACTTELPAHPPPNSPQGEIRYKTFVTARTDLNL